MPGPRPHYDPRTGRVGRPRRPRGFVPFACPKCGRSYTVPADAVPGLCPACKPKPQAPR